MKRKTISKEKLLNILKYVGIALAAVLVLGLIGSLFTGNSGGDGVRRPSVNRPSVEATEGTNVSSEEGSPESIPEVSESESETSESVWNYRVQFDEVLVDGANVVCGSAVNDYFLIDLNDHPLSSYRSPQIGGWFLTENGVSEFYYEVDNGEYVSEYYSFVGTTKENSSEFKIVLDKLGISTFALRGCSFNGHTFDMSDFAGQTVNFNLYAKTYDGRDILIAKFLNVQVPNLVGGGSD